MRRLILQVSLLLFILLLGFTEVMSLSAKRYKTTIKEDQNFWRDVAKKELERTKTVTLNNNVAKNVILFLGDGMSIPTLTAARIYKGQLKKEGGEEGTLFFETFPHVGLSKTYNVNKQVADSASTATAYLTGVKTNYKTIGVDGTAIYKNCSSINESNKVSSILQWAQKAGKRTGVVTSTRVTHATPAGTYAHVADRDWECDGAISAEDEELCPAVKDIATQLVEEEPGKSINVVMGGGYQYFDANAVGTVEDPLETEFVPCNRTNTTNLVDVWKTYHASYSPEFVRTKSDLNKVDAANTQFLLGLFSNGHMPYEYEKREKKLDVPTLEDMTRAAIEILQQEPQGYFLLVEGGRIDHAHHDSIAHRALDETVAMDLAVEAAVNLTSRDDTLIVVTADHAHTMSISGYPKRGQEITGLAALDADGLPYTTLMYANGPGYNYSIDQDHSQVIHENFTKDEVLSFSYKQLATVPLDSETHGGDDVAIYALGPMAHLFHTLHEQHYIAHAMAYASCIGDYTERCNGVSGTLPPALTTLLLPLLSLLWLRF